MHKVRCLVLLGSLSLLAGCAARNDWLLVEGQHPQAFRRAVKLQEEGRLLLFLPAGFKAGGKVKYPLLIFLHGSGEAGDDLEKLKIHGPPQWVGSRPDFPFIVASPQSPLIEMRGFDPNMLEAMLDELVARLPIDTDRVYLTGLSLGGMWSYGWASRHPERFAAIAPVSGTWDPAEACGLRNVPVWAFHGANDDVVPVAGDREMVNAINACGGHAKQTVYPDVGHEAWNPAYADPELYDWLLHQHRGRSAQ